MVENLSTGRNALNSHQSRSSLQPLSEGKSAPERSGLRVLVTGAAGYIGSVLCERLLAAGHYVTGLDNLRYGQQGPLHLCASPRFEFECGDARDEALLQRLLASSDVAIPLAAIVGAPACERDPVAARSVNLEAIRTLNRVRSREQLVIFPTTNSGYGAAGSETYCTEDTPLAPISLYGRTKVEAEAELLAGSNAITLRLATVFGMSPRMRLDLLVNHFVYAAVRDRFLVIFEGEFKRNYIHIGDVADCFVHCIEHAPLMNGRPFNVGLDEVNLSKKDLALEIRKLIPSFYLHFAPVGSDPDKRNYVVSSARLREAGFVPRRSLRQGLLELIKGYRMLGRDRLSNA